MRMTNQSVRGNGKAKGFSLIEVAVATIIVGIGVVALMVSVGAGTNTNDAGQKLTQAVFLAQEIREWTLRLPFSDEDPGDQGSPPGPDSSDPQVFVDDLDDLLGVTYDPPRDGQGTAISDMADWSQQITLTWRDPSNLTSTVANGASDMIYVNLVVSYKGQEKLRTGWLITRRQD